MEANPRDGSLEWKAMPASIDTCGAAIRVLTAWLVFETSTAAQTSARISLTLHPCMGNLYALSLVLLLVLGTILLICLIS